MVDARCGHQGVETSIDADGFEFLNLQAGAAYALTPTLSVSPSLDFGLGRFSSVSRSDCAPGVCFVGSTSVQGRTWHERLGIGVRVTALVPTHHRSRTDVPPPPFPPPHR